MYPSQRVSLRRLFVLVLIAAALPPLHASESRVLSMGGTGFYIPDNSNVLPFPGTIMKYPKLVYGELRVKNAETTFTAGGHFTAFNGAVMGINLNRNLTRAIYPGLVIPDLSGISDTPDFGLTHAVDFLYGRRIGGSDWGFRLTVGMDGATQDSSFFFGAEERDESARYIELAAGISTEQYDASLFFGMPSVESEVGGRTNKWSGFGFGFNGRYFHKRGDLTLVPVVAINNLGTTAEEDTFEVDEGRLNMAFGNGFLYQMNDENTLILGVEVFGYRSVSIDAGDFGESGDAITVFPGFYLGYETRPKSWLFVRLGAAHVSQLRTRTVKPGGGEEREASMRDSVFDFSMGFGVHLGNVAFDFLFNENFLFEGPDFISGQGDTTPSDLMSRVSLTVNL